MAERRPPTPFRLYGGLACALAVVVCGAVAVALDAPQPLRALAAGGLVLWAPGYALTAVLLPPGSIGGVERALVSFATSLSLTAIPAVLLEFTGVRLSTASFLLAGCALTSAAAVLALRRLESATDVPALLLLRSLTDGRGAPRLPSLTGTRGALSGWRPRLAPTAAAIGIGLVLAGALVVARTTPEPTGIQGSSALAAVSAERGALRVEVISAELSETTYRLTMVTGARRVDSGRTWEVSQRADRAIIFPRKPRDEVELARFTLAPGDAWQETLDLAFRSEAVELLLYRGEERVAYRRVVASGASA